MYHISVITNKANIEEMLGKLNLDELEFTVVSVFEESYCADDLEEAVLFYFEEDKNDLKNRIMQNEIAEYRKTHQDSLTMVILREGSAYSLRKALELHVDEAIIRTDYRNEEEYRKKCQEVLRNLIYRLVLMRKNMLQRKKLGEYEFHSQQKFMDKLLRNILEKPEEMEFMLTEINSRYQTRFSTRNYQVLIISMNRYDLYGKETPYVKEVIILGMRILRSARQVIFTNYKNYGFVAILNYPDFVSQEQKEREWLHLKHEIEKLKDKHGEFELLIGAGEEKLTMKEVWNSFLEALLVLEYHRVAEREIYKASEFECMVQPITNYVPSFRLKELNRCMAMRNANQVREWFADFYENIEPGFKEYPPAYSRFTWAVYQNILTMEEKAGLSLFPEWKFITIQHIKDGRERMKALESVAMEVCHMLRENFEDAQEIALHAIAYMKAHYREPITLEAIAESCGLSASYFSRKFKEQTGENYIETLANIRVEEGQKLLESTNLPIGEIVELVGYCDEKHFRRLFVKHTGVTPSAYRKARKPI